MEFTQHQRLLLEVICQHFHETGTWPTCGKLDKALRRHANLDVEDVLKSLNSFMYDAGYAPLSGWNPKQTIAMNVRAFHTCQTEGIFPDLKGDLVAFIALIGLCIERYENGEEDMLITAEEGYSRFSALTHQAVDNGFQLIQVEGLYSQSSSDVGSWSFKVSDIVRKYRNVKTIEDYLAVRRKLLTPKLVYTGSQPGVQPSNPAERFMSQYTMVDGDGVESLRPANTLKDVTNPDDASQLDESADAVVPMELLQGTRGYIEKVARQINRTYNAQCYDACAVMIRRLIETLILEVFEAQGIADHIMLPDRTYLRLDGLINKFLAEPSLNAGRNLSKDLPKVKNVTDKSAHSRRYNALRSDLDRIGDAVRGVVEELVYLAKLK